MSRWSRRHITPADELPATVNGGGRPDRALAREELRQRIARALADLPPTQRLALTLRTQNGLSYEECAEVLKTSPDAIRGLIHRARRGFRKAYGNA
jgi:RNA polymerase sigma-70 factor (ECF subfamily)